MEAKNYTNPKEALRALSNDLWGMIKQKQGDLFNLALSGGETAKEMFNLWTNEYESVIKWQVIRFYWVDERCVPKTDDESNYNHAQRLLFQPLRIAESHIYRIKGEDDPQTEADRYSQKVKELLPDHKGLPRFDCIILGIGNDFHTASIFTSNMDLLERKEPYAVSRHPKTGQYRITMTGPLILNNVPILIPVLGKGKKDMLQRLEKDYLENDYTPAAYILSRGKEIRMYTSDD